MSLGLLRISEGAAGSEEDSCGPKGERGVTRVRGDLGGVAARKQAYRSAIKLLQFGFLHSLQTASRWLPDH